MESSNACIVIRNMIGIMMMVAVAYNFGEKFWIENIM
jgi:hypothetical protein